MMLSEKIKQAAPTGAQFFRLQLSRSDGSVQIFPADAASYYRIGESPFGLAPAKYSILFYDAGFQSLPAEQAVLTVDIQGSAPGQTTLKLSLHPVTTPSPRLNQPEAKSETTATAEATPTTSPSDFDLDLRRQQLAMDIEDRQQEFIKNSVYVTEVGEVFALNRLMRREIVELQGLIVQHAKRAYQDIDHVKGAVHELIELQRVVLTQATETLARPPAPPPDYVGLGHSALAAIKEIGVALIQRSSKGEGGAAQLAATSGGAAQLVEKVAEAEVGDAKPDGIGQVLARLRGLSEGELATRMATPEGWKGLLDELRGEVSTGTAGKEGA